MALRLARALPWIALLGACGGKASNDTAAGGQESNRPGAEAYPELADCVEGMTEGQVEWQLGILGEVENSLHEMIACGGLYFDLLSALIGVLVNFAMSAAEGAPEGFTYAGAGLYETGSAGTWMGIQLSFGDDYGAGAYGDPVTADLFDIDSYLLNASVEIDYRTFEILVYHDGPGPLVELLGRSSDPNSPIRLDSGEVDDLSAELGKLLVEMDVVVLDDRDVVDVGYNLDGPRDTVSESLDSGRLPMLTLDGASAESSDTDQDLATTDWAVEFEEIGSLDGTIDFAVTGGAFDYVGVWTYNHESYASRQLACPP